MFCNVIFVNMRKGDTQYLKLNFGITNNEIYYQNNLEQYLSNSELKITFCQLRLGMEWLSKLERTCHICKNLQNC